MTKIGPYLWAAAVVMVAILNIVEVLPDWATFAAILTLPLVAVSTGMRCNPRRRAGA
mgnify:CR=1 FL=1